MRKLATLTAAAAGVDEQRDRHDADAQPPVAAGHSGAKYKLNDPRRQRTDRDVPAAVSYSRSVIGQEVSGILVVAGVLGGCCNL